MNIEDALTRELMESARLLEARFRMLSVPTRKIPLEEWNSLPSDIQKLVPKWIPTLLANHSVTGGILECRGYEDLKEFPRWFSFMDPSEFVRVLTSRDYIVEHEIIAEGMVPISHEQNGDMWVTGIGGEPSSAIYLFSLSAMQKRFASSRIALLMASMGISEMSFYDGAEPNSVMWYPEK